LAFSATDGFVIILAVTCPCP